MAIQFIDNQPITWNQEEATWDACKRYNDHGCTTYTVFDWMYAQWKQDPCNGTTNVFCNPLFTNSSPEKITNGNFTSGSTGWVLTNATWDSINKRINFSNSANGSMSFADTFTTGSVYEVKITVGGTTQGYLTVALRGATNYSTIYGTGTYTFYITAGSTGTSLSITSTSIWNGWVDDVSVKLHAIDCTEFSGINGANDWVVLADGLIKKNANYAADFYADFNAGSPIGGYYKISFNITGYTAGTLLVKDGGNLLMTITGNGYYETFATISSVTGLGFIGVGFSADADFDGTIGNINAIQYANYFNVILESTTGGTNYDLSGDLIYYNEYITLKKELGLIAPGCYQLCVYDACGYAENIELLSDPSFDNAGQWTLNPGTGSGSVAGGKLTFTSGAGATQVFFATNGNLWPSYTNMVIDWTLTTGTSQQTPGGIYLISKNNIPQLLVNSPLPNTTYSGTLNLWNQGTASGIAINTLFTYGGGLSGKIIELTDLSLNLQAYLPGRMTVRCSNCIEIKDDDSCMPWVGGTNGEDSFGFHFDPTSGQPFEIGARINAMMINPKYKGEIKSYTDSEGNNIVTKAKTDKEYTFFINYTDEHNHDWLRVAMLSDNIRIGTFTSGMRYYVSTDGDYQPEWPDALGTWPTAQAKVTLIEKTKTLLNNNAG